MQMSYNVSGLNLLFGLFAVEHSCNLAWCKYVVTDKYRAGSLTFGGRASYVAHADFTAMIMLTASIERSSPSASDRHQAR